MSHNHRAVVAVFRSRAAADACFAALVQRGYLSSDINVMMTERTRKKEYAWANDDRDIPMAPVDLNHAHNNDTSNSAAKSHHAGTMAGSMAAQGIGVGGSVGTAVGATLAAIAAVGTSLVIPGLNLIVAGPILAALAGGGAGAVAGGLVGGLVGLGIQEQDAEVYNRALQEGGVVMSVSADAEHVREIEQLMLQHSGEQVASSTF